MYLEQIVGFILSLLMIGGLIAIFIYDPAEKLRKKFIGLGILVGKKKNKIASVAGLPKSINRANSLEGNYIATWQKISHTRRKCYSITLLFNEENVCVDIISESYLLI